MATVSALKTWDYMVFSNASAGLVLLLPTTLLLVSPSLLFVDARQQTSEPPLALHLHPVRQSQYFFGIRREPPCWQVLSSCGALTSPYTGGVADEGRIAAQSKIADEDG